MPAPEPILAPLPSPSAGSSGARSSGPGAGAGSDGGTAAPAPGWASWPGVKEGAPGQDGSSSASAAAQKLPGFGHTAAASLAHVPDLHPPSSAVMPYRSRHSRSASRIMDSPRFTTG